MLGPKYPYHNMESNFKIGYHSTSPHSKVDNSLAPLLLAFMPVLLGIGTALGLLVTGKPGYSEGMNTKHLSNEHIQIPSV